MTEVDPAEVVVRGILRSEWNAANTLSVTPDIHHGHLDIEYDQPEITISNPDERAIRGGETGYSGMSSDGTPSQLVNGTLDVNVWVSRDRTSENPRKLAHACKEEVRRIIQANARAPTATHLSHLSWLGATRQADTETDVVIWRYFITIGYGYGPTPL